MEDIVSEKKAYDFCLPHMVDLATAIKNNRNLVAVTTLDIENMAFIRMSLNPHPEGIPIPVRSLFKAMFEACSIVNA